MITALLILGTEKVSDQMQMWCLNTQFHVFGIFRGAVEEAEEQLGPSDSHDTAHLLQHNPDEIFFFKITG